MDLFDHTVEDLLIIKPGKIYDAAGLVDDHIAGDPGVVRSIVIKDTSVGVQGQGIGDMHLTGKAQRFFTRFFQVDADKTEILVFQLLPQGFQVGHLFAAHTAPTCGELQNDDLSPQIAQFFTFPAVGIMNGEAGSYFTHTYQKPVLVGDGLFLGRKAGAEQQKRQGKEKRFFHKKIIWTVPENKDRGLPDKVNLIFQLFR